MIYLISVSVIQGVMSRQNVFDASFPAVRVDELTDGDPPEVWKNMQVCYAFLLVFFFQIMVSLPVFVFESCYFFAAGNPSTVDEYSGFLCFPT